MELVFSIRNIIRKVAENIIIVPVNESKCSWNPHIFEDTTFSASQAKEGKRDNGWAVMKVVIKLDDFHLEPIDLRKH